jgi:hypothetical protein
VYLDLKLPPRQVEVNVHPTKKEVGFLHQQDVIDEICRCRSVLAGGEGEGEEWRLQGVWREVAWRYALLVRESGRTSSLSIAPCMCRLTRACVRCGVCWPWLQGSGAGAGSLHAYAHVQGQHTCRPGSSHTTGSSSSSGSGRHSRRRHRHGRCRPHAAADTATDTTAAAGLSAGATQAAEWEPPRLAGVSGSSSGAQAAAEPAGLQAREAGADRPQVRKVVRP